MNATTNLKLPLLDTRPVQDVAFLVLLLPVFWFLGIEQFVWPIAMLIVLVKAILLGQERLKMPRSLQWFGAFVIVHAISGLFIVESFRWLTFARNFGSYVAAFLVALILVNSVKSWDDALLVIRSLGLVMGICIFVGILGIMGLWRPNLSSVVGTFLPQWIKETYYGNRIAFRIIGQYDWFAGWRYFRVISLFAFATMFASALAITLPIVIFLYSATRRISGKLFWLIVLFSGGVCLLFTTGRVAAFSFAIGGIFYFWYYARSRKLVRLTATVALGCVATLIFVNTIFSREPVPANLVSFSNDFYYARRASVSDRGYVYQKTIEGWLERPILGWGTERDIPDHPFPAGSHSHYLGILYKQGAVGLIIYVTMMIKIWQELRPVPRQNKHEQLFLVISRWVLLTAIFNGFTDVLDLDATVYLFLWIIVGLVLALKTLPNE
ncbi:MAG: O-antigen ligase family protein [Anaerolineales bacterium]|nr:O-antigen ligase family protein [Anaerolineales bacterium]